MKPIARVLPVVVVVLCGLAGAQQGKWKPYQFQGNERYEYKIVVTEGEEKKETGYVLDIRKKGDDAFDVTWSVKSTVKKGDGAETLMAGMGMGFTPAMWLLNPMYGAFLEQIELKEGEKLSLYGAGMVKVVKKETVGGRTGFACELLTKQDDKDQLTWAWTVDPELALPIRSITYENGQEKLRADLVSYKKD